MKKIYILKKPNFIDFNEKSNDLMNKYFPMHYNIVELNLEDSIKFIQNSKSNDIIIIFYLLESVWKVEIFKYLKKNKPLGIIIFRTDDFWHRGIGRKNYEKYYWKFFFKNIYNFKITSFTNIETLENVKNISLKNNSSNIYTFNYWCVYDKAICKFNKNSINKILLTGKIGFAYPERDIIKKYKNIESYSYNSKQIKVNSNDFNLILNNYLCCFTSSISLINSKTKKRVSVHIFLLKIFEILGSGSLLLYPKKEEDYIKKIGLYHKKNCWLIDFNSDIQSQIDYIIDIKNRKQIDEIRFAGWTHGKDNLNSLNKFNEFNNLIKNI